eukprot:365274-Chlamydomonas_euryale.AAC.14
MQCKPSLAPALLIKVTADQCATLLKELLKVGSCNVTVNVGDADSCARLHTKLRWRCNTPAWSTPLLTSVKKVMRPFAVGIRVLTDMLRRRRQAIVAHAGWDGAAHAAGHAASQARSGHHHHRHQCAVLVLHGRDSAARDTIAALLDDPAAGHAHAAGTCAAARGVTAWRATG